MFTDTFIESLLCPQPYVLVFHFCYHYGFLFFFFSVIFFSFLYCLFSFSFSFCLFIKSNHSFFFPVEVSSVSISLPSFNLYLSSWCTHFGSHDIAILRFHSFIFLLPSIIWRQDVITVHRIDFFASAER